MVHPHLVRSPALLYDIMLFVGANPCPKLVKPLALLCAWSTRIWLGPQLLLVLLSARHPCLLLCTKYLPYGVRYPALRVCNSLVFLDWGPCLCFGGWTSHFHLCRAVVLCLYLGVVYPTQGHPWPWFSWMEIALCSQVLTKGFWRPSFWSIFLYSACVLCLKRGLLFQAWPYAYVRYSFWLLKLMLLSVFARNDPWFTF